MGPALLTHAAPGDLPPPLTPGRLFTVWGFEPWPALAVGVALGLYLWGVATLRARGDSWSAWRTAAFATGLGAIVLATQSALGVYDTVLLSVHMAQHMLLSMVAPVFLALGAPVTLALRTLRRRPRGWLVAVLHSRPAKVLAFPVVAGALFIANPWALYFTGWYPATLDNAYLHETMHLHFVLVGCLFFWPMVGLDPVPGRLAYPFRLLVTFVTLPFHAFLGITVMGATTVIAYDWYASLERDWGPSLLRDQYVAGGILWGSGDLLALLFFGALFVQWMRESEREARREDRRLDRLERLEAAARARAGRPGAPGADADPDAAPAARAHAGTAEAAAPGRAGASDAPGG